MTQTMNEDSDNQGKHHDGDDAINDNAEENGMGYNKDFNGFDKNEDVTRDADETYMYTLEKLTGIEMFTSS